MGKENMNTKNLSVEPYLCHDYYLFNIRIQPEYIDAILY